MAGSQIAFRPLSDDEGALVVEAASSGEFSDFGTSWRQQLLDTPMTTPAPGAYSGRLAIFIGGDPTEAFVGYVIWHAVSWGPSPESTAIEIGIALLPHLRGLGLGTAAQRALVAQLLDETAVERVQASTDVDNELERRALISAGFQFEGTLRRAQFRDGDWRDMALFAVTRADHFRSGN